MPTDFAFRLSTYLTLGLSCLCLGYSEWDLLPEVTIFTSAVIVLLTVSFLSEGRFELTISQANRLGLGIGTFTLGWVGFQFIRPSGGLIEALPWPASLLPYLGPLLMVLMPAKLFRPKHVVDWWAMQGIALVAVGLACAITDDEVFASLMLLYVLSMVVSVSLFFLRDWSGAVPPVYGPSTDPPPMLVAGPQHVRALPLSRAMRWAAVAGLATLPAFFLAPQSPGAKWQLALKGQAETGLSMETTVDLTRTGDLKVNHDITLEVLATQADGRPKIDLDPNTRFRAGMYAVYHNGRWSQKPLNLFYVGTPKSGIFTVPHLELKDYVLDYRPTSKLPRAVLAEPMAVRFGEQVPVVTPRTMRAWSLLTDGTVAPSSGSGSPDRIGRYRQYVRRGNDITLGAPYELFHSVINPLDQEENLALLKTATDLPRLQTWANEKLEEFVRTKRLSPGVLERFTQNPIALRREVDPRDFEAVARAFQDYFRRPGVFQYDLKLPKQDTNLDPIEDFVLNTRTGHCERFASALALSLRSVGVPTAFVLGFKGFDHEGEGRYLIRQEHAHAWVYALIPRPTPPDFQSGSDTKPAVVWHWLSLDPTPGAAEEAANVTEAATWFGAVKTTSVMFYNDFIIGYDADRRQQMTEAMTDHLRANRWWYLAAAATVFLMTAGRIANRQWIAWAATHAGPVLTGVAWYDSAIAVLTAAGMPIRPGQTPQEHAAEASTKLEANPATATVAGIPRQLAAALYQARYAGRPTTADEASALQSAVERLTQGLKELNKPEVARA